MRALGNARLRAALGLVVGFLVGACCHNPRRVVPSFESRSLTTLSLAGRAAWGTLTVDDSLTLDIDIEGETVEVFFTNAGREVVHTYRIVSVEEL
jgi:hypothetical protein